MLAVNELLDERSPLRSKVAAISAAYRARDGAKEAAERISGLVA
jgi:hypothetical protein